MKLASNQYREIPLPWNGYYSRLKCSTKIPTPLPNCPSHAAKPKGRTEWTTPTLPPPGQQPPAHSTHATSVVAQTTRHRTRKMTQRKNRAQLIGYPHTNAQRKQHRTDNRETTGHNWSKAKGTIPADARSGSNTECSQHRARQPLSKADAKTLRTKQSLHKQSPETGSWGESSPRRQARDSPKPAENKPSPDHSGARTGSDWTNHTLGFPEFTYVAGLACQSRRHANWNLPGALYIL